MKKIINNKVYDTETSQRLVVWENGRWGHDDACRESLYRKRTGEFFLHGEGGPMSKYAKSRGDNSWSSGEELIPLSYEAAQKWAEDHLTGDQYEAIFGAVADDDSKTRLTLYLSNSTIERAKRAASQAGIGLSAYIESLIP